MKNTIFLLLSLTLFIIAPQAFGAFPSKHKEAASYSLLGKTDTRLSLADRFNTETEIAQPQAFSNTEFKNRSVNYAESYSKSRKWCFVHKLGLVFICSGGGLMLSGIVVGVTAPKSTSDIIFTDQDLWSLGLMFSGFMVLVLGLPLLIGGSIHDHRPGRYGLIAPKSNEIGVAYNLHR